MADSLPKRNVSADSDVMNILPRLLDTEDHRLGVTDDEKMIGIIDEASMLAGLGRLISPRDDCSIIVLETSPSGYSASHIAHAVEDAEVHLVDLLTSPGKGDTLRVTLRVRTIDPSAVISNLERYGYEVVESEALQDKNLEIAIERLLSLNTILGV